MIIGNEPVFNASLICQSRRDLGYETEDDEDVNVYLGHLLNSEIYHPANPIFYESDLIKLITAKPLDNYQLYKRQANALLLAISLYKNLPITFTDRVWLGRCSNYYDEAVNYGEQAHITKSILSPLHKLHKQLPLYILILDNIRSEYFNFVFTFSQGEWYHLTHETGRIRGTG